MGFWEAIFGSKSIIKDRSSFVLLGYCGCVILRLYKKNGDKKRLQQNDVVDDVNTVVHERHYLQEDIMSPLLSVVRF